ncbi:hypothetical protein D3C71_2033210 [compost metagenome]
MVVHKKNHEVGHNRVIMESWTGYDFTRSINYETENVINEEITYHQFFLLTDKDFK